MFADFRIPCLQAGMKFIGVLVDCKKKQVDNYFEFQTSTFVKPISALRPKSSEEVIYEAKVVGNGSSYCSNFFLF